jgi:hypothetical protein
MAKINVTNYGLCVAKTLSLQHYITALTFTSQQALLMGGMFKCKQCHPQGQIYILSREMTN